MFGKSKDESGTSAPHRPLRSYDRRRLERAGWRTTLEFQENHHRTVDGRLLRIDAMWLAEAERIGDDGVDVVCARANTESRAWARVASAAFESPSRRSTQVHEQGVRDLRPIS